MHLKFILFYIITVFIAGCGIDGMPTSPSAPARQDNFEALIPFGDQKSGFSDKEVQNTQKYYTPVSNLENIGRDYSANFGLENDELEDVFDRLAPPSAQPKRRRPIIKLK